MGRLCSICGAENRVDIDEALKRGESSHAIAARFEVSASAVQRHRRNHLSPAIVTMANALQNGQRAAFVDRIEALIAAAETMFSKAATAGSADQALNTLREIRLQLELLGKASGELKDQPLVSINLLQHPEAQAAMHIVLAELADQPEVRGRIAERLQLEAGSS